MKIQIVGELEFRILSKEGILEKVYRKPMESLLANFIRFIYTDWSNTTSNWYDTANNARAMLTTVTNQANAPPGNNDYGILVGTGTNAITISDYNLQTKITHGPGAGQLGHLICVVNAPVIIGSQCYITISRNFTNDSGSTITVREVALITSRIAAEWYFLMARDLTGDINVLATKTLAALYTFRVTV